MEPDKDGEVDALLRAGADPTIWYHDGFTPLCRAARLNMLEDMKLLLKYSSNFCLPADSLRQDEHSMTPLAYACFHNHAEILELLLHSGAHPEIRNHDNRSPLNQAVRNQSSKVKIVQMLLANGASLDSPGPGGSTLLAEACQFSNVEVIQVLINAGANIETRSKAGKISHEGGYTPLMRAVLGGQLDNVSLLLKSGAKANAQTEVRGKTALLIALEERHYGAFGLLMDAGADANIGRHRGRTPLIQAAMNGAVEQAQRLSDLGADPKKRDFAGCTAWICAKHSVTDHLMERVLGPRNDG